MRRGRLRIRAARTVAPALACAVASALTCAGVALLALGCTLSQAPPGRGSAPAPAPPPAEQVEREIERSLGTLDDPALATYVAQLGARIAAAAELPKDRLRFAIANQPENNAFSFASGNVYLSRGLLAFVRSEDELANVMAHEVAHVQGRHALQLEARKSQVQSAALMKVLTGTLGGGRSPAALEALQLESAGLVARYSRDLEHAADRDGQLLAARAGFDPMAMATFLAALDRETTFRLGRPRRPTFLDTHPAAPERAQNAATLARRLSPPVASTRPPGAFLARLDGLLVGEDPAEGVVRDGVFLHADLDLRLAFPTGWRVTNTRAAVIAAPDGGPLVAVLELQEAYPDPAAAAVRFLRAGRARFDLLASGPLTGAAVPAHQAAVRLVQPGDPVYARIYWLALGGNIYRLQAVGTGAGFERLGARVEEAARGFRPLRPEERAGFRVRRLRIVSAAAGERFDALLARAGNVERLDQIALMNDLDVADRLVAGRQVKVVVESPYPP